MASYLEDRGILTAGERNSPQTELLGRVEHHGLKRRNMSTLYGKPASQTRTLVDAAAQRWVLIDEDKKPVEKLLRYHNGRLPQRPSTVDFWPTTSQDSVTATSSLRPPPVPVSHPLRNNSSGVPPSPLAPVARSRLELPTPNALLKDHCNISHRVEAILGSSNAVTTTSARPHLPHVAQGNSSETQPMSMHLPPILHTPNSTLRQVSCLNPTIQPPNKQTSTRVPAIPLPTPPPATPPTPIIPYHSDPAVNLLPINFAQARACPLECPPSEFRPINPGPTANVTRNDPSVLSGPLSSSYYFIHRRPSISTPVQAPPWLNERSIGRSSVQDQKASQPTIERLAAHPSALSPRTSVPASQVLPVSVPPDFPPSMSTSQHFPDRMYRPPVEHQRTYSSLNYRGPSFMTPSHSPSKVPPVDRSSAFTSINQQAPADHTLGKESMTRPPSSARSWTNGSHTVPTTLDEGSQNEEFLTGQAQTEGPWYFRSETGCVTCKRQRIECGEKNPYCNYCVHRNRYCEYPPQHVQNVNLSVGPGTEYTCEDVCAAPVVRRADYNRYRELRPEALPVELPHLQSLVDRAVLTEPLIDQSLAEAFSSDKPSIETPYIDQLSSKQLGVIDPTSYRPLSPSSRVNPSPVIRAISTHEKEDVELNLLREPNPGNRRLQSIPANQDGTFQPTKSIVLETGLSESRPIEVARNTSSFWDMVLQPSEPKGDAVARRPSQQLCEGGDCDLALGLNTSEVAGPKSKSSAGADDHFQMQGQKNLIPGDTESHDKNEHSMDKESFNGSRTAPKRWNSPLLVWHWLVHGMPDARDVRERDGNLLNQTPDVSAREDTSAGEASQQTGSNSELRSDEAPVSLPQKRDPLKRRRSPNTHILEAEGERQHKRQKLASRKDLISHDKDQDSIARKSLVTSLLPQALAGKAKHRRKIIRPDSGTLLRYTQSKRQKEYPSGIEILTPRSFLLRDTALLALMTTMAKASGFVSHVFNEGQSKCWAPETRRTLVIDGMKRAKELKTRNHAPSKIHHRRENLGKRARGESPEGCVEVVPMAASTSQPSPGLTLALCTAETAASIPRPRDSSVACPSRILDPGVASLGVANSCTPSVSDSLVGRARAALPDRRNSIEYDCIVVDTNYNPKPVARGGGSASGGKEHARTRGRKKKRKKMGKGSWW